MRRFNAPSLVRRTALALVIAVAAAAFVVPVVAGAAAKPVVTIKASVTTQANAAPFTLSGTATPRYATPKLVTIYIEKPGTHSFSMSTTATVSSKSKWSTSYSPKIAGKFYFKAYYNKAWSAIAVVTVKKAPVYELILASTTSTQDSGLFSVLIPAFEKVYPWEHVNVLAVGSGEALTLGQNKDADVCLVHSPASEVTFMNNGYGVDRQPVCYNDFIVVGPTADPANILGDTSAADAFSKIATAQAAFVSRGDASGTNSKELAIWALDSYTPAGKPWYYSSGQGMGATLLMADNLNAYTLSDRATWVSYTSTFGGRTNRLPHLSLLVQGDGFLLNPYHVIRIPNANNMEGAADFENYILSQAGQTVIGQYGITQYGQQLFHPDFGTTQTPDAAVR